jgi:hypothetical protein
MNYIALHHLNSLHEREYMAYDGTKPSYQPCHQKSSQTVVSGSIMYSIPDKACSFGWWLMAGADLF